MPTVHKLDYHIYMYSPYKLCIRKKKMLAVLTNHLDNKYNIAIQKINDAQNPTP